MRSEIRGHAEWPNAATHHQLGLLCLLNRGGPAAPDSRQLLGSRPAQNGGNGKALATKPERAGSCRSRRTLAAGNALIRLATGRPTRVPHFVRNAAHFPSKPRPTSFGILPHFPSKSVPHFPRNPHADGIAGSSVRGWPNQRTIVSVFAQRVDRLLRVLGYDQGGGLPPPSANRMTTGMRRCAPRDINRDRVGSEPRESGPHMAPPSQPPALRRARIS